MRFEAGERRVHNLTEDITYAVRVGLTWSSTCDPKILQFFVFLARLGRQQNTLSIMNVSYSLPISTIIHQVYNYSSDACSLDDITKFGILALGLTAEPAGDKKCRQRRRLTLCIAF